MSAIGNYVHYTAYGYNAYGIQKSAGQKRGSQSDSVLAINKHREQLSMLANSSELNPLSERDMQGIENSITALMKPASSKKEREAIDLAWQMICDQLAIDFYDGIADQISRGSGNVKPRVGKMKAGKTNQHYLSTFLDKIQKINSLMSEIKSVQKLPKLQNALNNIESALIDATSITQDMLTEFKSGNASAKDFLKNLSIKNSKISSQPLVDAINGAANLLKGLSSYAKGQMFETLVAVAQVKLNQMGEQAIKQALGKIKGGNKTGVYIKEAFFDESINLKGALGEEYTYSESLSGYVSTSQSSNKVDVDFDWHGKTLKTSIKNVNLYAYPKISLVKDAPFLALLQSMEGDFVNHYLNIMVPHYALPPGSGIEKAIYNQATLQQAAKEAMKINLLLAAFTGHKLDADTADVFIVNNNAKGDVKVFNIGFLLRKAMDNLDLIYVKINPDEQYSEVNNFKATVGERLTNIMTRLHGMKVRVEFVNSGLGMI